MTTSDASVRRVSATGLQPDGASAAAADEGLLAALADFACRLRLESVPDEVRGQARLCVLDTVGCMVAGQAGVESRAFREAELRRAGDGGAMAIGVARRLDPQSAARINAYLGDVFELNDLIGGHASIGVVPAALALAQHERCSGRALLEAVIAGVEVTSRVYAAYYPSMKPYQQTGITPPGIPSTIGAAAAAARLLGFDRQQTQQALAIAATLAGWCPAEVIFGQGGTIKPMLFGAWPATAAIQAAHYAQAGFTGPARILESPIGLYATLAHRFDEAAIRKPGLWHLAKPRRKRHACCGYIHSALDAVLALRAQGVDLQAAHVIEVGFPAYIIAGVSKAGPPSSANEARFHAEYCIALAAQGADVIAPTHSVEFAVHLPRVRALMQRIRIVEYPAATHYQQCRVSGRDAAGNELFALSLDAPKGAPADPMSDDEVRGKFAALCADALPGPGMQRYLDDVDALEHADRCDWIIERFSTHTAG